MECGASAFAIISVIAVVEPQLETRLASSNPATNGKNLRHSGARGKANIENPTPGIGPRVNDAKR